MRWQTKRRMGAGRGWLLALALCGLCAAGCTTFAGQEPERVLVNGATLHAGESPLWKWPDGSVRFAGGGGRLLYVAKGTEDDNGRVPQVVGEIIGRHDVGDYRCFVRPLYTDALRWEDVDKWRELVVKASPMGTVPLRTSAMGASLWYVSEDKVYGRVGPYHWGAGPGGGEPIWGRLVQCVDIKTGKLEWSWFERIPERWPEKFYGPFCVTKTGQIILTRRGRELGVYDKANGLQARIRCGDEEYWENEDKEDPPGKEKVRVITLEDVRSASGVMCMEDGSLRLWDSDVMIRFKLDGRILGKLEVSAKDDEIAPEDNEIIGAGETFVVVHNRESGDVMLWDEGGKQIYGVKTPFKGYGLRAMVISDDFIAIHHQYDWVHLLHIVERVK